MLLGEATWWHPSDAAVRADLVVVAAPGGDLLAGLMQRLEPMLACGLVVADARLLHVERFAADEKRDDRCTGCQREEEHCLRR